MDPINNMLSLEQLMTCHRIGHTPVLVHVCFTWLGRVNCLTTVWHIEIITKNPFKWFHQSPTELPTLSERKRKRGTMELSPFVNAFVRPSVRLKLCGRHHSANTDPIHPNKVHWDHLGLYMCNVMVSCPSGKDVHAHGRNKGSWNLTDAGSEQPPGGFTPNQVH